MSVNLLLVAAGSFWLCSIVGLGVWWHWQRTRRRISLPDVGMEAVATAEFSDNRAPRAMSSELYDELTGSGQSALTADGTLPDGCDNQDTSGLLLRFPYPNLQWMAPCRRGRMPAADDFVAVECHELFGDGVSFYSDAVGQQQTVVISLGTRTTMIFMLARVTTCIVQPGAVPGKFLVECQFIRRVRAESAAWNRVLKSRELVQELNAS